MYFDSWADRPFNPDGMETLLAWSLFVLTVWSRQKLDLFKLAQRDRLG